MSHKPQLWVIAGPNGSGKTTLTRRYFYNRLPVVNPDDIAAQFSSNNETAMIKAGRIATKQRQHYLTQGKSFAFETTFSGRGELQLMRDANNADYKVNLVFISTESPTLSRGRVRQRVEDGGHHVSSTDIIRRYHRSLNNLPEGLKIAERAFILDNSGNRFRLLLSRENQKIKTLARTLPHWLTALPLGFDLQKGQMRLCQ